MAVYERFVNVQTDYADSLKEISFNVPAHFNFAYDVVDVLGSDPRTADMPALLWIGEDFEERRFTFRDIMEYSSRTANMFKAHGIGKGDNVMLILRRHYQFWFSMMALHKLGAAAIPATDQLLQKDLTYRFNAGDVKAVVATAKGHLHTDIDASAAESPSLQTKILVGTADEGLPEGWVDFNAELMNYSPVFERPTGAEANDPEDTMVMFFTSGTTGYPKLAMHSYTYPLGHVVTARWWQNVNVGGLHLTVSDTGWGKALWGKLYGQWFCERCVFVFDYDRFNAHDLLSLIAKYKVSSFCAPPTIYRFFIKEDLSKYDLSSLKYAAIAGEALNPEVYNRFREATGLRLMEGFGQTETTLTVANLKGMTPKPGSMGKPNPAYAVEIVDPEGKPVRPGAVGEVVLRTDIRKPCGVFKGYYKMEDKTAEVWHDGMYHTGDMAWADEDGYFWYEGRKDDIIKSSGYRIGPFEIESVLMELPYVLECAVIGVPDEIRGQVVKAIIVLKGAEPSDELVKEIQKYVKSRTAPYKYPRVVEFVTALPKTISGKIKRAELRNNGE